MLKMPTIAQLSMIFFYNLGAIFSGDKAHIYLTKGHQFWNPENYPAEVG